VVVRATSNSPMKMAAKATIAKKTPVRPSSITPAPSFGARTVRETARSSNGISTGIAP
jgi:hypothetical protein